MLTTVFLSGNGNTDEYLELEEDGTFTHHIENAEWKMRRKGLGARTGGKFSADQAKAKWPSQAAAIDRAITSMSSATPESNSN